LLLGCVLGGCCHGEDARSDAECWITTVGWGLVFGVCGVFVG